MIMGIQTELEKKWDYNYVGNIVRILGNLMAFEMVIPQWNIVGQIHGFSWEWFMVKMLLGK